MAIALDAQSAVSESTTSPITRTITATAGAACFILIGLNNGATVSSISYTAGGGGTWNKAKQSNVRRDSEIWYSLNTTGGSTTASVALIGSPTSAQTLFCSFTGLATTGNPLDGTNSASGTTSPANTGSITPTQTNVLFLAAIRADGTVNNDPNNSFTALNSPGTNLFSRFAYRIVNGTSGSYSTQWTHVAANWDAVIIAVKEPATTTVRLRALLGVGL